MDNTTKYILIGLLVAIIALIVILLVHNSRKNNLKKEIDALNVRFNAVKTVPLAFKLSKAQAMAKRNNETATAVAEYYNRYEDAQKHIDQIQELINTLDDSIAYRKYKDAKEALKIVSENISDSEKEIEIIDKFLEQFQEEENNQREYSARLKEQFRDLKMDIQNDNVNLAYSMEGLEGRISEIEELFTLSEECMYGNDFVKARDTLEEIDSNIQKMRSDIEILPDLIKDARGVLPILIDEVDKQYALIRQRGVYVNHLNVDDDMETLRAVLNSDLSSLLKAKTDNVRQHITDSKEVLRTILESLDKENHAYLESRELDDKVRDNIAELKRLKAYIEGAYEQEKDRFGLGDMVTYLADEEKKTEFFSERYEGIHTELIESKTPSTELLGNISSLYEDTEVERKALLSNKQTIDQTANDEQRAIMQLTKLQVVINEVEIKVKEYRLPAISDNYYKDLEKGKEYIATLKKLLDEIPLNITELNKTLQESIDYIYALYNNVNNIVGMAIMVENAIVFGNKYRSSYPEVDRELSKAEFSYLNGEYTKALTIAITCMETLFPNVSDEKILENA